MPFILLLLSFIEERGILRRWPPELLRERKRPLPDGKQGDPLMGGRSLPPSCSAAAWAPETQAIRRGPGTLMTPARTLPSFVAPPPTLNIGRGFTNPIAAPAGWPGESEKGLPCFRSCGGCWTRAA